MHPQVHSCPLFSSTLGTKRGQCEIVNAIFYNDLREREQLKTLPNLSLHCCWEIPDG